MNNLTTPRTQRGDLPTAHVDPITDETTAFGLLGAMLTSPRRHETLCLLLHHDHTGAGIVAVRGTEHADDVIGVVESVSTAARPTYTVGGLAVASVRPGASQLEPDDGRRWQRLLQVAEQHDVALFDWWVVGAHVMRPRALTRCVSRWPAEC